MWLSWVLLTRSATGLRVSFPLYLACEQDRVKAHSQEGVGRSPFWEAIGLAAVVCKASNEKNLKPACLGAFRETFLLNGISRSRDHGGSGGDPACYSHYFCQ